MARSRHRKRRQSSAPKVAVKKFADNMRNLNPTTAGTSFGAGSLHVGSDHFEYAQQNWMLNRLLRIISDDATTAGWTWDDEEHPLERQMALRSVAAEALKLCLIEKVSVALFDDGSSGEQLSTPLKKGGNRLPTIRRLSDFQASSERDENMFSPNYGLPLELKIKPSKGERELLLHPTRYLFIKDGPIYSYSVGHFQDSNSFISAGVKAARNAELVIDAAVRTARLNMSAVVRVNGTIDATGKIIEDMKANVLDGMNAWVNNGFTIIPAEVFEDFAATGGQLAHVAEVVAQQLEIVAAAYGVVVTKFLGKQSKGLANGGQGDLENHYTTIQGYQETILRPLLEAVAERSFEAGTDFKFNSLWKESDKERSSASLDVIRGGKELYEVTGSAEAAVVFIEKGLQPLGFDLPNVDFGRKYTPQPDKNKEMREAGIME